MQLTAKQSTIWKMDSIHLFLRHVVLGQNCVHYILEILWYYVDNLQLATKLAAGQFLSAHHTQQITSNIQNTLS